MCPMCPALLRAIPSLDKRPGLQPFVRCCDHLLHSVHGPRYHTEPGMVQLHWDRLAHAELPADVRSLSKRRSGRWSLLGCLVVWRDRLHSLHRPADDAELARGRAHVRSLLAGLLLHVLLEPTGRNQFQPGHPQRCAGGRRCGASGRHRHWVRHRGPVPLLFALGALHVRAELSPGHGAEAGMAGGQDVAAHDQVLLGQSPRRHHRQDQRRGARAAQ
mmetsp:Transcript_18815/g.54571  ORF Transcript_18815/g.54571 Transcript_18815/m.54571 type:complete len:217 (-) Transcript_18815:1836-2486(-)